jgi:hypothetical protein
MDLFRVFAYQVEPSRTSDIGKAPSGGAVTITPQVKAAVQPAAWEARGPRLITVDLNVDTTTRTCPTRDWVMNSGFGSDAEAGTATLELARRLSGAMDGRSSACLFIVAAERNGDARRITTWTFPQDEAFQFKGRVGTASVKLLTDVFSRKSHLRKAAWFEGKQVRTAFLSGKVLDFQANQVTRDVADFWIVRFLDAKLGITPEQGTRMLANSLRKTWDGADGEQRQQLWAAMASVRQAPRTRWSMADFADQYLADDVRERFEAAAPNADALNSSFDLDRTVFDSALQFRVFQLESNVYVSAPFDEVGRSVRVTGEAQQHLVCEGNVVEDKMSTRRA